jgi:hypothetical protein
MIRMILGTCLSYGSYVSQERPPYIRILRFRHLCAELQGRALTFEADLLELVREVPAFRSVPVLCILQRSSEGRQPRR